MWEAERDCMGRAIWADAIAVVDGIEYAVRAEKKLDGDRLMVRRLTGRSNRTPYGILVAPAIAGACLAGDIPPEAAFDYAIENMSPEARAYALGYGL